MYVVWGRVFKLYAHTPIRPPMLWMGVSIVYC